MKRKGYLEGCGEKKILRKRMKNVGFKRHNINFVMFHIKNGGVG
jgi:hypothetical protein